MKFKGTIVITDPCYILPEGEEHYNLWDKCECGKRMEVFGIRNYITKSTIYGDWSCTTYETEHPKEVLDDICDVTSTYLEIPDEEYDKNINELKRKYKDTVKKIGVFCADSGQVSVFLLNDILRFNPNYLEELKGCEYCATIIKDFDGEVEYYINEDCNSAHIIGKGNINFFTIQTGL
jgi:hypothetical protein